MSGSNLPGPTLALPRSRVYRVVQRTLSSGWGARITAYVVFLVGWQLLSMIVRRVPGPGPVFVFLWTEITAGPHGGVVRGQFLEHFIVTLQRFGIGLALAVAGGGVLGLLIGSTAFARALLNDTLLVFLALPAIIWAFLTTMWFGIGPRAPIFTTALTAAPFVAVNVAQGVRAIGPDLYRMSAAYGVPLARRIRHLVLPAVMGYLFAGIRFAIIIGWNGVLLSEWFGAAEGVGWRTRFWYDANRYRGFVGWVVLFIVFIVLLDRLVLTRLQQRAFRWRDTPAASSETTELTTLSP
jgi:ABC-type nitrate/sulfonate/bicarbonate transport system permease component